MKNIFRNIAIATAVSAGLAISSCQDMMTLDTGDKAYENAQDTLYSYLGIMRAMQDVAERQVILGEIRGDLVASSEYATDTLFAISNFDNPQDGSCSMLKVSDYYNIINNCNLYIHYADTSAVKSNVKYMIPEYAQVKTIRAWAYLQLVKNYREVPYITEPITSLDVINNFNYTDNLVNKDNLVDRLIADGLEESVNTPYPQYGNPSDVANNRWGSWENGATKISSRLCFIPTRVVLGDLYLLRGGSQADYERAARYYYDFLHNEETPQPLEYGRVNEAGSSKLYGYTGSLSRWAATYSYSSSNEVISLIPSAANASLGRMLTRVADIYGYTPSSAQSSDVSTETDEDGNTTNKTDDNGNEVYDVKGAIYVSHNIQHQYAPSNAFLDVNAQQTYVTHEYVGSVLTEKTVNNADARNGNGISFEDYTYEGESYLYCAKAAYQSTFFYTIPTYRKTLVWLRLAEAINRCGYPKFAFAILKEGLNQYTLPEVHTYYSPIQTTMADGTTYLTLRNVDDDTKVLYQKLSDYVSGRTMYWELDEDGTMKLYLSTVSTSQWSYDADPYRAMYHQDFDELYYVTDTLELQRFNQFLDFTDATWDKTYGIHARGAGGIYSGRTRTNAEGNSEIYHYVSNIQGTLGQSTYDYDTQVAAHGLTGTTKADTINAVENIIVDELALETAFEGNRFTDLVRIAEHKNASGYDGTEWLARKVANRGTKAAVGTSPAVDGFDAGLYAKLKNPACWYFQMPAWSR